MDHLIENKIEDYDLANFTLKLKEHWNLYPLDPIFKNLINQWLYSMTYLYFIKINTMQWNKIPEKNSISKFLSYVKGLYRSNYKISEISIVIKTMKNLRDLARFELLVLCNTFYCTAVMNVDFFEKLGIGTAKM